VREGLIIAFAALLSAASSYAAEPASGDQPTTMLETPLDDAPPGENAASYDSSYQSGMRLRGSEENTPEADARPGEYYFKIGARAFQKNDSKFAVEMYEVAASWAYKPAAYNLGVMYARGQGIPVDYPRALAWMALAAERGEERYVAARNVVQAQLTAEQVEQARLIVEELKKTYGDEVALRRAKARWADVRSHMTGSRVGSVGHLDVGVPQASADPSNQKGQKGTHKKGTTSGEILGGEGVDGSIAYRQLLESDNPYDPKFERKSLGTAHVEPLIPIDTPVKNKDPKKEPDEKQEPDPVKKD
jgi:TPR repeat protein